MQVDSVNTFYPQYFEQIEKSKYINAYISLDTETSHNHAEEKEDKRAWLESWCFKFGSSVVFGRKPSELIEALNNIREVNELVERKCKVICFIHNLSYDLAYIKDWLTKEYGEETKKLVTAPRKYISYNIDCFEFRCSYKLSNRTLQKWAKDLQTVNQKDATDIDYTAINYQDSELTPRQIEYQIGDVLTLDECISKQLDIFNDTLATIPLTSTGYIRREIRREFHRQDYLLKKQGKSRGSNRKGFKDTRLDVYLHKAMRLAFHGGYTHLNRYYREKLLDIKDYSPLFNAIKHRDFRSHYPSQQRAYKFPVGKFTLYYAEDDYPSIKEVLELTKDRCLLISISMYDVRVKEGVTMPLIQSFKCRQGSSFKINMIEDNGRVLECLDPFTLWITEYELIEYEKQYTFEYRINEVWSSKAQYLPSFMTKVIDFNFKGKSDFKDELKALEDREKQGEELTEEIFNSNMSLMKSKNGLNGIFGCSATNPVHEEYTINDWGEWETIPETDELIEEKLNKFYNSYNSVMREQWGTWTTSLAQYELFEYMECITKASNSMALIYADTDSLFYFSNEAVEQAIEELNEKKRQHAIEVGAYITRDNGDILTYDAFTDENENIVQFKSLHSKCYAYNLEGYETAPKESIEAYRKCTIAGVTARSRNYIKDGITRLDELGDIDELKVGKVFSLCGGTSASYIEGKPRVEIIDGHEVELSSACIIENVEKRLSTVEEETDIEYLEIYQTV